MAAGFETAAPGASVHPGELADAQVLPGGCPSASRFPVRGFGDADSWVPGFFTGEGHATRYGVNLQPRPAFSGLRQDLQLAAAGAPHRIGVFR